MKLTEIVNPRQTILLTTKYKNKENIITLDWHTPLSFEPPMYAVAIGKTRYSLKLIKQSKVFVINFMSPQFQKEILFCGRNSGRDIDKFKETKFTKEKSKTIDCPRIKEALGYLECIVEKQINVGDHILFIGKITNNNLKKIDKRIFHIKDDLFTTTID